MMCLNERGRTRCVVDMSGVYNFRTLRWNGTSRYDLLSVTLLYPSAGVINRIPGLVGYLTWRSTVHIEYNV
jgi:hypothetical protein